jgi:hypothetical protein
MRTLLTCSGTRQRGKIHFEKWTNCFCFNFSNF